MPRSSPRAEQTSPPAGGWDAAAAGWGALFLALALVPDQKLLRAKLLAVQTGLIALIAGWIVRQSARVPRWIKTPLDVPVLLYGLSGLLFFALSPEPRNSESELARVLLSCGAFFCASQASDRGARWITRCWTLGAALAAAYALAQRADRPFSTFGNPIFLGCFLAASLPAAVHLASSATRRGEALAAGAAALAQAAGLWSTQSRAALAGLLAAALAWSMKDLAPRRRLAALAGVALAAGALVVYFQDRAWTHGLIWRDTLALWRAHPWLGCGLGRFHVEFPAYASPALRSLWPQGRVIVNFAHNEYLQVLAETGVVGLAAFAAIPLFFLFRFLRGAEPARGESTPYALAAAALFASALFSPDMRFGASSLLAFACLGFWSASAAGRAVEMGTTAATTTRLLASALGAALAWLSWTPALALRRLNRIPAFHEAVSQESRRALEEAERDLARQPENAQLAEKVAFLHAKEKAWQPALTHYRRAAELAPGRPGPHNNMGNIAYILGDYEGAIFHWKKSLAAKPDQLDAHLNLAKLLYERGRLKESAHHCHEALKLDANNEKARVLLKKMTE